MPLEGYRDRAVARAELELLRQQLLLRPEFVELVEKADKAEGLSDYERGVVRVLKRAIRIARALPPWLVAEMARVEQEAMVVWREARAKNDFEMFRPYLEKIFDLSRKAADYLGWDKHPYDALLDLYEEGLRMLIGFWVTLEKSSGGLLTECFLRAGTLRSTQCSS